MQKWIHPEGYMYRIYKFNHTVAFAHPSVVWEQTIRHRQLHIHRAKSTPPVSTETDENCAKNGRLTNVVSAIVDCAPFGVFHFGLFRPLPTPPFLDFWRATLTLFDKQPTSTDIPYACVEATRDQRIYCDNISERNLVAVMTRHPAANDVQHSASPCSQSRPGAQGFRSVRIRINFRPGGGWIGRLASQCGGLKGDWSSRETPPSDDEDTSGHRWAFGAVSSRHGYADGCVIPNGRSQKQPATSHHTRGPAVVMLLGPRRAERRWQSGKDFHEIRNRMFTPCPFRSRCL